MPKRKSKPVEFDEDETPSPTDTDPVEAQEHGSLRNGDIPPPGIAAAIEAILRDNPYTNTPQEELEALALTLYDATHTLRLVEQVLQARNSVW